MNSETALQEKLIMAAASDIGTVRDENEDFFFYSKAKKFLVVCDGMGGHNRGALASRIAGETLRDLMLASDTLRNVVVHGKFFDISRCCSDIDVHLPFLAQKVVAGIRLANRHIFYEASRNEEHRGMGTTLAVAAYDAGKIIIGHIGDSRVYRLRDGVLSVMTSDHSWLNELIEDQEISEDEAEQFKKKNVLTRALGIAPRIKVDLLIEPARPNDLYLVCTDGLYNALSADLIESVLTAYHGSLQNKITNLVKSAKLMDGSDNITGGFLHVSGNWQVDNTGSGDCHTLPEEPPEIGEYLDQTLRTVYLKVPQKDRHTFYRTALIVIVLGLLIASAFVYLNSEGNSASVSQASFGRQPTGELQTSGHAAKTTTPPAPPLRSDELATAIADQMEKAAPSPPARVFVIGKFKEPQFQGARLFVDGHDLAELKAIEKRGFRLDTGVYTFEIQSITGEVIAKKSNVKIFGGESIAIEF